MYKSTPCYAVVAAAGSGERFRLDSGASLPKQFAALGGKPVIVRSLALMEDCPYIDGVVVSVKPDFKTITEDIIKTAGFIKIKAVVTGGGDRQSSVFAGLKRVLALAEDRDDDALVVVHDAVRPLTRQETLAAVITAAYVHGSAVAAAAATDTIKVVNNGFVVNTPARETLFLTQTPQAFRLKTLIQCHEHAASQDFHGSDDAVLAERMGVPVFVVETGANNIKITTAMDLTLAEMLLKEGVNNGNR